MRTTIELRQTRDFGEVVSDCIIFIRQNWKSLLKNYFVFCGFFMAGILIFGLLERARLVNQQNAAIAGRFEGYSAYGLDYFMVLLFSFMNIISATLSTLSYIALYAQNKQAPSVRSVWVYYKYYFWRTIGHFLLLFVIFLIGAFILAIPFALFARNLNDPFVTSIIILVCMVMPLIYFITVLNLFFPTVIIENSGFGYAFSQCFRLVKRRWWNTFGVLLVSAIIYYSGFLLIVVPFSIFTGAYITYIPFTVSFPVVFLYKFLLSVYQVFNIFPMIASAITYFSYMEEKEHIGLIERIETLGVTIGYTEPDNEVY